MPSRRLGFIFPLLLTGCATSAIEFAPQRPDQPWTPKVDASGEAIPGKTPSSLPPGDQGYVLPLNAEAGRLPAPPDIEGNRVYSLADLIDLAQSSNPQTRTAWNNARSAALAAGIARSAYLPKLTASVLEGYQNSYVNTTALGTSGAGRNTADGSISALSLQWLLFDFGERSALLHASEQVSLISNIAFTAAHQQVIYEVSVAFYTHAAARARLEMATRGVKNAETVQRAAEARFANGVGTSIEVAQARQATAQAQLLQVQADGDLQNAYLTLIAALGISPLTHLQIAEVSGRELPDSVPGSIEQIVSDALGRRPDVLAAYAAELASEENVRAARAEFMPKFFLSATSGYNSSHLNLTGIPSIGQQLPTFNLSNSHWGSTLFAGVSVPVYDGGTRAAALNQARAAADNAKVALTHTRNEAVRQIVLAQNTLRTNIAAHHAASSLSNAAQLTFDSALAAYRNGVGSITEVTLAETQLLQASNAFNDSYSATLSAAAGLALAAGSLGSAPAEASLP